MAAALHKGDLNARTEDEAPAVQTKTETNPVEKAKAIADDVVALRKGA